MNKSALVAEDNPALSRVIGFTMRKAGFRVEQARDGLEAWEHAQDQTFDLVITDQQMPEMSGLELCANLRQQEKHQNTPVVLLTAKGMELDTERIKQTHGISEIIIKPFSPTELTSVAKNLMSETV